MRNEKNPRHTNIIFIIIVLVSLITIFLRATPAISLVKKFIYYLAYPSVSTAHQIFLHTGDFAESIKSYVSISQENLTYRRINQELSSKLYNYNQMKREYDSLMDALQIPRSEYKAIVFARISIREPSEWYQWFILDKGAADGLENDLPVFMLMKNGVMCAVGSIVETYEHSAKVVLITNLFSAVPVRIRGKNINSLAEGMNSIGLKITYIPFNADVAVGDVIEVSPLSAIFPPGTLVGVIKSVSTAPSTDFKTALADVVFDKNIVNQVIVIVGQKELL
ncbi:MAG: rod shape-determining protein MreC [Elusimicrobiota bacterium]|jgi:rod shape-determining protein MreC|nr:rod shape-determining protein MreC [Elusimicrobiota bacterium]